VVLLEVWAPIDEHIIARGAPARRAGAGDQHELLVEQVLDDMARRLDGPVHDGEVQRAFDQALGQRGGRGRDRGNGDVRAVGAQARDPFEEEALPQSDGGADREMVAMLVGEAHFELRALPDAHERERVLPELLARGGEVRAGLGAFENGTAQQVFEALDAGRNRRLRDVELRSGLDEAAGFGNHQERSSEVDVHAMLATRLERRKLSIEIFDSRHRKNPFEAEIDSHHIEDRLDVSRVRFGSASLSVQWKD